MKNRTTSSAILAATLFAAATAFAADDSVAKHTLTLEGARKAAEAGAAYAQANGAPGGAIAVVDDGGHLLYFARLNNTFPASANVSIGKARTAALFRKPTSEFETLINQGRFTMTALPPDFTPLQGGVPIRRGRQIVGAIGVSGAQSAAQDEEIANAGARAIAQTDPAS